MDHCFDHLVDDTIDEPYDWPLHVGNANGFIAANGEADTILLIPKQTI